MDILSDIYRTESRRILSTLIRLLRDFDLAEEALSEAFAAAAENYPQRKAFTVCSHPGGRAGAATARFAALLDACRRLSTSAGA